MGLMDDRQAAAILGGRPSASTPKDFQPRMRQGVVTDVTNRASGLISILLGSDTTTPIPGVSFLASYTPVLNDVVWVMQNGTDLLVIGRASGGDIQPFAMASGQVTINLVAATQGIQAVTFPTGRFTVGPNVSLTALIGLSTPAWWIRTGGGTNTTGFNAVVNTASAVTAAFTLHWIAVQMTPTAADG